MISLSNSDLLAVLRIAHDVSTRGAGLSLRAALARTRYGELRRSFDADSLEPLVRRDPSLAEIWLAYSEDKRTSSGWFVLRDGTIGQVGREAETLRFETLEQAVAEYAVRELDFWLAIGEAG